MVDLERPMIDRSIIISAVICALFVLIGALTPLAVIFLDSVADLVGTVVTSSLGDPVADAILSPMGTLIAVVSLIAVITLAFRSLKGFMRDCNCIDL